MISNDFPGVGVISVPKEISEEKIGLWVMAAVRDSLASYGLAQVLPGTAQVIPLKLREYVLTFRLKSCPKIENKDFDE